MNPLASFATIIATAQDLAAAVNARDDVHLRPDYARQAIAQRLRSGLIVLRAFLRRLIILIALHLEWSLVDKRGPMKRPHKRKSKSKPAPSLKGIDKFKRGQYFDGLNPKYSSNKRPSDGTPVYVDMAKLYAELDYLTKIAADPLAKAQRLAFHLARSHPYVPNGPIMAPKGPDRIAGRWGTEVRAYWDFMSHAIVTQSKNRPPPLPPPRHVWPMITLL